MPIVMIIGPSGCGKTRLVQELLSHGTPALDMDMLGRRDENELWIIQEWRVRHIADLIKTMGDPRVYLIGASHNIWDFIHKYPMCCYYVNPSIVAIRGTQRDINERGGIQIEPSTNTVKDANFYESHAIKMYEKCVNEGMMLLEHDNIIMGIKRGWI